MDSLSPPSTCCRVRAGAPSRQPTLSSACSWTVSSLISGWPPQPTWGFGSSLLLTPWIKFPLVNCPAWENLPDSVPNDTVHLSGPREICKLTRGKPTTLWCCLSLHWSYFHLRPSPEFQSPTSFFCLIVCLFAVFLLTYFVFLVAGMNGTATQDGCKDAVNDNVRYSEWSLLHTKCSRSVCWDYHPHFWLVPSSWLFECESQLFCFSFIPAVVQVKLGVQNWILGSSFNRTVWCTSNRPIPQSALSPLIDAPCPLNCPQN